MTPRYLKTEYNFDKIMNYFPVIFLVLVLSGCKKESPRTMTLTTIESLSFRRSYAGHEHLTDKQLDSLYKTNPVLDYEIKQSLSAKLNKKKILNGKELRIEKFKENLNKRTIGRKIEVSYSFDFKNANAINIVIKNSNEEIKKHVDFDTNNFVGVVYEDLNNDTIEEILILENFYMMNGDNFVLSIFKLTP